MSNDNVVRVTVRCTIKDVSKIWKGRTNDQEFINIKDGNVEYEVENPNALKGFTIAYHERGIRFKPTSKVSPDVVQEAVKQLLIAKGIDPSILDTQEADNAQVEATPVITLPPAKTLESKAQALYSKLDYPEDVQAFINQVIKSPTEYTTEKDAFGYVSSKVTELGYNSITAAQFKSLWKELS